jgi:NAD(P)-dependent dehydrogenase (short-subunit alcohol dehydrogenase family)
MPSPVASDPLVAVVTGAASGIGRALVHECENRGMRVFATDISLDPPVDVRDRSAVDAFARCVYEQTANVDFLFNNAGVMPVAPLVDTTDDDWTRVIGVNLLGVMNVVRAFVPFLRTQPRAGRLVNTASLAGFAPPLGTGNGAYAATKAAVVSVSETLAHELRSDGIAVSVVCPSGVATQIFGDAPAPPPSVLMTPVAAATRIVDGVLAGRVYVFTHTDDVVRRRLFDRWATVEADFVAAERGPTC